MRRNEEGSLFIPLVLVITLLVAVSGFAIWAFMGMQDYKNNSDQKSAVAAEKAVAAEDKKKDAIYAELEKNPFRTYKGPETYGTLTLQYPKTWSAYVVEGGASSSAVVDGYFQPGVVPVTNSTIPMALRIQVIGSAYDTQLASLQGQVKAGKVTVTPYRLPKVPSILGTRLQGQVNTKNQGIMVMLPLRDKTLLIWTEGTQYVTDFEKNILPNATFVP